MKVLRSLAVIVIAAALTVASAWRLRHDAEVRAQWQSAGSATPGTNGAGKTLGATVEVAQLPVSKNAQVAAPVVAPVPASGPPPIAPASGKYQARAEVGATIADMIPVLESGDIPGLIQNFAPPEELAMMTSQGHGIDEMIQKIQEQPAYQAEFQKLLDALRSIQNQTPTYNDAGDEATYTIDPPPENGPRTIRFKKENGLWYMN